MIRFKSLFMLGFGALLCATPAAAQSYDSYPDREVRLVLGFAAGSGADILVRYFAEKMRVVSGKSFIVDNKPGAQGNLALEFLAKAKPDGYTATIGGGSALAASQSLFKKPAGDPLKDFDYFGTVLKQGFLVVVDARKPFKTLQELTAYLKEKKASASYATATATGTVMGEMYKAVAGLETVQVNYRTIGDALTAIQDGSVDFAMADSGWALGHIAAGRVRALAIGTEKRITVLPDIPTMGEAGVPGLDVLVWWAGILPAGTPRPIVVKLQNWLAEVVKMDETKEFLRSQGTDVWVGTADDARAQMVRDIKKWGDFIRTAKIEPAG